MFDIFDNVSDIELKNIFEDIAESRNCGNRPRSLDSYYNEVMNLCKMKTIGEAIPLTDRLFYDEVAKRYFKHI